MSQYSEAPIKPYNIKALSQLYGMSKETMRSWIAAVPDLGQRIGRFYNVDQVKKIFKHLGAPEIKNQ